MPRFCRAFLASLLLLVPATASAAGAVLPSGSEPEPASVGVRMVVAGTTRWSEVTIPRGSAVGWLVPVRPGASVDWAPDAWLASLDEATAPRILPPSKPSQCPSSNAAYEVPPRWSKTYPRQAPAPFTLVTTADSARSWATTHGFRVSATQADQIDALYASGWQTVGVELAESSTDRTTATLRVTDDGGALLPLVLTGEATTDTKLTVFVIGRGIASVANMQDVDPLKVLWGPTGSTYATRRESALATSTKALWLRESASHAGLFEDVAIAQAATYRGVVPGYFEDADCAATIAKLGRSVAPVDPAKLSCGGRTDLGLALAGTAPSTAVVTRLAGLLPRGASGSNVSVDVAFGVQRPAVMRSGGYAFCDAPPDPPDDDPTADPVSSPRPPQRPGTPAPPPPEDETSTTVYVPSDGCSGSTVVVDDSTSDDDDWETTDSSDSCTSDTSSSSDGWDSSDSSDSCSSDTSSSDGWDSSDSSSSCSTVKATKRRGPNRLSRFVLLAVALLLPLRRRLRPRSGDPS